MTNPHILIPLFKVNKRCSCSTQKRANIAMFLAQAHKDYISHCDLGTQHSVVSGKWRKDCTKALLVTQGRCTR